MNSTLRWTVPILTAAIFSCCARLSPAHDGNGHTVTKVEPSQMYVPSAIPDRIVLTWTGDPKVTQAVTWRTSIEVSQGVAELAVADAGPGFTEGAKLYVAETTKLVTNDNTAHFHTVQFTDLQPGSTYGYRVGDGTNWSEWFHFRTATESPEPFSFVYFGDAQNNIRSMWSRVIREAQRDAPQAAFLLHAGDLVNRAEVDSEWGEWFAAGGWLNAMIPSVAVPGNHEQAKSEDGQRRLTHHWRPQFAFPENGPAGVEESCYTLTYHNLRIIALDSNRFQEEQAVWLEQVLERNRAEWVVCTFHHPIFSTSRGRDNPELRRLWKPIFDRYQVDLVLQGHDHTYGRTGTRVPDLAAQGAAAEASVLANAATRENSTKRESTQNLPTGVQAMDQQTGTVYVVSVSGPKMYNNSRRWFMRRVAEDTQLYQVIRIDGRRLRFEARTAIGELYDAFELVKQPGKTNALVEYDPEIPERLRSTSDND